MGEAAWAVSEVTPPCPLWALTLPAKNMSCVPTQPVIDSCHPHVQKHFTCSATMNPSQFDPLLPGEILMRMLKTLGGPLYILSCMYFTRLLQSKFLGAYWDCEEAEVNQGGNRCHIEGFESLSADRKSRIF